MAIITRPVWTSTISDGELVLDDVPNVDAYGLAVIATTSELAGVDWTQFYDGTLVIDQTAGTLSYVISGALVSLI